MNVNLDLSALVEQLKGELLDELRTELRADQQAWPEWMRLPTAARYVDVTEHALRKRAERREIPFSQEAPGCALWFNRSDLDTLMESFRHDMRERPLQRALDASARRSRHGLRGGDA